MVIGKHTKIALSLLAIAMVVIGATRRFVPSQKIQSTMAFMYSLIGYSGSGVEFATQQNISGVMECTNGVWKEKTGDIPVVALYDTSSQYYEGDLVSYVQATQLPKNDNCNTESGGTSCEQYYCVPKNEIYHPAPASGGLPTGVGYCDLGKNIGDACVIGSTPGTCMGVCKNKWSISSEKKFIGCDDQPYDTICEEPTPDLCVGKKVSCGGGNQLCGENFHMKTFYESVDIDQGTPGLCNSPSYFYPGSLTFSIPHGRTWKCATMDLGNSKVEDCHADVAWCGDDNVDLNYGEQCDNGKENGENMPCTSACQLTECGNGKIEGIEQCDDGNTKSGDGCDASCKVEAPDECTSAEIEIKVGSFKVNNKTNIEWKYRLINTTWSLGQFMIYDVDTITGCPDLKQEVAKAYCADMYDSQYFDASKLIYKNSDCMTQGTDGYELRLTGTITCCEDYLCDDGEKQECDTGMTTPPGCKMGTKTCDENTYGACIPENSVLEETCYNGEDDNCNGEIDEGCTEAACCKAEDEPGVGDNIVCFEGATCCGDGTWKCNDIGTGGIISTCGSAGIGNVCTCTDEDNDGYCKDEDCNDTNPSIHPGATDICGDGIDQNCDEKDEECTNDVTCYKDSDSDSLGVDPGKTFVGYCPEGWVTNNNDCDDSDKDLGEYITCVYDPDQEEGEQCGEFLLCIDECPTPPHEGDETTCNDDIDNDCDGDVDEEDDACSDDIYCREDLDDDGYGWGSGTVYEDVCPDGWVSNDDDCDDDNEDAHEVLICDLDPYTTGKDVCDEVTVCADSCPDIPSTCIPKDDDTGGKNYCGNGIIASGEECDDGNARDGDGCDANCNIEVEYDEEDEEDTTGDVFAEHLAAALNKLEGACDYDDYNYQDIMFRDVQWDPDSEAINTLLAYCIVKGYDRTKNQQFHLNAATSKAEAIKVVAKLDAMGYGVPFDEDEYVRNKLPYKDMKPNAWYTTYVMYAHAQGLLDGIGSNEHFVAGSNLKALTPIKKSEMRTLLRNAGITKDYRELDSYGTYLYRDDMANIMVDAFSDKLKDYQYLYGNNIKLYSMLLARLEDMSPSKQVKYIKNLVKKLKGLDHRMMGENFNLHLRGMIEFLEIILDDVV